MTLRSFVCVCFIYLVCVVFGLLKFKYICNHFYNITRLCMIQGHYTVFLTKPVFVVLLNVVEIKMHVVTTLEIPEELARIYTYIHVSFYVITVNIIRIENKTSFLKCLNLKYS